MTEKQKWSGLLSETLTKERMEEICRNQNPEDGVEWERIKNEERWKARDLAAWWGKYRKGGYTQ